MENGEKEPFFGSDRMELLAYVIGESLVWLPFGSDYLTYLQARSGRDLLQTSSHNFSAVSFKSNICCN